MTRRRPTETSAAGCRPNKPPRYLRLSAKSAATGLALGLAFALSSPSSALAQPGRTADAPATGMQGVEAYLSEDAMQILYVREMDFGELGNNEVRGGFFFNEERDLIGIADMMIDVGDPQRRPYWGLQVGPRAYGALMSVENQDIFSVGFGGKLSYYLGRDRATSIWVTAFYAPDIVTFGNADNIKDVSVGIETRLTDSTRIFLGYRMFEFDLDIDREVDDNMHLGIRYEF